MLPASTLSALSGLAEAARRQDAADELARRLGVDALLVYVRDPEIGALLPAPGFPQTSRGGPSFRAFLGACAEPGTHRALVEYPADGPTKPALARVGEDGSALLLVGGDPDPAVLEGLDLVTPILFALLRAEHAAQIAAADAVVARAVGRHAHDLALALDAARSELESALSRSERLNEQLQETDRRKDEFLAMLGHELRNPMAAISGAIELARTGAADASTVRKACAVAERQAAQLSRLVDDLLDVARITRGKIALRKEPCDVAELARRAVEATRPLIASKRHALRVEADGETFATVDPARVEQMITNLLTNAAKYTDEGGSIALRVERRGDEVHVLVKDSGIGIAEEMLDHVFDPFVQVSPSIDRGAGGIGIGLTLVQRLAELHGGRVEATSEPGVGSEFVLRLPACEAPRRGDSGAAPELGGARPARPKRVLLVDDNADSTEMLSELIATWGHEVRSAHEGEAALRLAVEFRPELVLLDLGLPGLDGFEVAKRLRAIPETRAARVVALTGYGLESDRARTREAGFDTHLTKPVDFAVLQRALED